MAGHELEVKNQECEDLEKDFLETQTMMEQSTERIHELEEVQAQLQKQVQTIKSVWVLTIFKNQGFYDIKFNLP